jgi:hypothetical protein
LWVFSTSFLVHKKTSLDPIMRYNVSAVKNCNTNDSPVHF